MIRRILRRKIESIIRDRVLPENLEECVNGLVEISLIYVRENGIRKSLEDAKKLERLIEEIFKED